MNKKILFYTFWFVMLLLGPVAVVSNTPLNLVLGNKAVFVNFLQRIFGTMAFGALAFQITLGSNMNFFRKILGGSALKSHIANGLFTYSLIIMHPLMWVVINYLTLSKFDPYFPFVDVCLLCQSWSDWIYNFGRLAFWLFTVGIIAGLFRGYNSFMRQNWRKFHIVNYFAFAFVALHSINIGTDVRNPPFVVLYFLSIGLSIYSVSRNFTKIISQYRNN